MRASLAIVAAVVSAVGAVPVDPSSAPTLRARQQEGSTSVFPAGFNGTVSPNALNKTNVQAHGQMPSGGAPKLTADDLTSFQLIAFNEIFEVAFFTSLLNNVTSNVTGYEITENSITKDALVAIQAQEELHADNANAILQGNGKNVIQPCKYKFPTTSLPSALALAKTFTDVVMGTLADVQLHLAENGAAPVVPVIGSVIGQEGEQTGFFRSTANRVPSSQPFLTRSTREFAYSALNQMFVVPGSCPNAQEIDLPIFKPLTVTTANVTAQDQTLSFSAAGIDMSAMQNGSYSLVYINSQTTPVVVPITNVKVAAGVATFDASFPYSENLFNGLTIAAVTNSTGPFMSAEDVAKVTVAGPGLIEVD